VGSMMPVVARASGSDAFTSAGSASMAAVTASKLAA